MKPFTDDLFVEIDRPNERLVDLRIEINGDSADNVEAGFARDVTPEQMRALVLYAAEQVRRFADDMLVPPGDEHGEPGD